MSKKPLGRKAYGHIPHLPGSRMTKSDHKCTEGQKRICTERARDKHDHIHVSEKLDGSNVAIAKLDGMLFPLTRTGYVANTSLYEQHHHFFNWVMRRQNLFLDLLGNGERICGEWLMQAHGTRYKLFHDPIVFFDLFRKERVLQEELRGRISRYELVAPYALHEGRPFSIEDGIEMIKASRHGAIDPVEGAVWRVERNGKVDFLAKYVRPDKIDGKYLPEYTGKGPIWNWVPEDDSYEN